MNDKICGLCGIRYVANTYRFAYNPSQPVHQDAVYTRICLSAINAQKERQAEGEEPLQIGLCINQQGQYNPKYRWIANPQESV